MIDKKLLLQRLLEKASEAEFINKVKKNIKENNEFYDKLEKIQENAGRNLFFNI